MLFLFLAQATSTHPDLGHLSDWNRADSSFRRRLCKTLAIESDYENSIIKLTDI